MVESSEQKKSRPPKWLFALGPDDLPAEVTVDGITYRFVDLFKHDFFAATGLYQRTDTGQRAVLKLQRTYRLFILPMKWLGRIVANHEIDIYQRLQGVRGIPGFWGRVGPTGFLHEFIPGQDLHAGLPLTPEFFEDLKRLLEDLHARHIAYVDTNKRENILYGEDGKPWLIDFQISFQAPRGDHSWFIRRWWLGRFQRADWYHYYKHKSRLLPAACSPADLKRAEQRGPLHNLHRLIANPYRALRRRYLRRFDLSKTR